MRAAEGGLLVLHDVDTLVGSSDRAVEESPRELGAKHGLSACLPIRLSPFLPICLSAYLHPLHLPLPLPLPRSRRAMCLSAYLPRQLGS